MGISQSIDGTGNLVFQNRKWKFIKMLVSISQTHPEAAQGKKLI